MALINCTECNKEISDRAISCPNCGNPMLQQAEVPNIVLEQNEGCFMQTLNVGCSIVFIIIGLILLLVFLSYIF